MTIQNVGILNFGGVGEPPWWGEACREKAVYGFRRLLNGRSAVSAVCKTITLMEDSGLFNAGIGSALHEDGSVLMDAGIMDSKFSAGRDEGGHSGGVIHVSKVQNPILLARRVMATPYKMLAGKGADNFAEFCTMKNRIQPSEWAKIRYDEMRNGGGAFYLKPPSMRSKVAPGPSPDTIGVVARGQNGDFAAGVSTGGFACAIGRVGDAAIPGIGYFAGPKGAVAVTGLGEFIMENFVALSVYRLLASYAPQEACDLARQKFGRPDIPVGIIAISEKGAGVIPHDMPHAILLEKKS